jgi:putative pyruvate formate lyase activating enzyme
MVTEVTVSVQAAPDRFLIPAREFEPAYLALYRSGELQRRAQQAIDLLAACRLCPRHCGTNRLSDRKATCKTGRYAVTSSYFAHRGEENCLRGWHGSGTIFFAWCNLRCVFCQNFETSQLGEGATTSPQQLADMMLRLQDSGCHNINFVTPEHVVPQVLEALVIAVEHGLRLPIVYNTSAYDSAESLHLLDGVIDIYMPDFKFWDEQLALKYLKAKDYPQAARHAIKEMHRQVGALKFDENGIALHGVLVRHLVMPDCLDDTKTILRFLAEEVSPDTYVNIMAQYYPSNKVSFTKYPELNRRITLDEYKNTIEYAQQIGLQRLDERHRLKQAW